MAEVHPRKRMYISPFLHRKQKQNQNQFRVVNQAIMPDQENKLTIYPSCLSKTIPLHPEIGKLNLIPPVIIQGKITALISDETEIMKLKGAILEVPPAQHQFLGHIFLRPNKDRSQRSIFNLKKLHHYVQYPAFQNGGTDPSEEFATTRRLDAKTGPQGCLLLCANDGTTQEAPSVRVGSETLRLPVPTIQPSVSPKRLHKADEADGWNTTQDRDQSDILPRRSVHNEPMARPAAEEGRTIRHLLESLVFVVNVAKSHTTPTRDLEYLGMIINSPSMMMRLSEENINKFRGQYQSLLQQDEVSVRDLSKLIGTLSSTDLAVLPVKLYYRELQRLRTAALNKRRSYATLTTLTAECKGKLRWWMSHLQQVNGREMRIPQPDMIIDTDACLTGWGAATNGHKLKGHWIVEQRQEQINILELRAILLTVKAMLKEKSHIHVHFRADNTTAVSHINKMGGTHSPALIAREIWEFCFKRKILISAEQGA